MILFHFNKPCDSLIKLADKINAELKELSVKKFNDGSFQVNSDYSGQECAFFHSFQKPFDNDLPLVLRTLYFLLRSNNLNFAVFPFLPFLREKNFMESSFSMDLFPEVQIFTLDSHINIEKVNSISPLFFHDFVNEDSVVVFPDAGAFRRYSGLNFKNKVLRGYKSKVSGVTFEEDSLNGKNCVVFDDIFDSGFTAKSCFENLKKIGAGKVDLCVTHILNSDYSFLKSIGFERIFTTNSIFADKGLDYFSYSDKVLCKSDKFLYVIDFANWMF